jgi:hypothetical protein
VILVVTHPGDEHARPVLGALSRRGAEVSVLDLADPQRWGRLALSYPDGRHGAWIGASPTVYAERIQALWWRRPRPPRPPRGLGRAAGRAAAEQSLAAVMGWIASLQGSAALVNHPWLGDLAGHKTLQLAAARRAGLLLPTTLVTSDPAAAREFLRAQGRAGAVHKAVASRADSWRRTRRVGPRGTSVIPGFPHAPAILQQRIPGPDVRVTIVGDQVFAAEIDARRSGSPDDYRGHERQCRFTPCRVPVAVERGLRALMRDLGLLYGAADFRRGGQGDWYFLELNPEGQWLFVEQRTGQPISAAVAELLASEGRPARKASKSRVARKE